MVSLRRGQGDTRKPEYSQKQRDTDESVEIQRKRKGPHTPRVRGENGEGTGVWGQEQLNSLEKGKCTKTVGFGHVKERLRKVGVVSCFVVDVFSSSVFLTPHVD